MAFYLSLAHQWVAEPGWDNKLHNYPYHFINLLQAITL